MFVPNKININSLTHGQSLALFCGSVLILLLSMYYRLGLEVADDGAFFLRYADNILRGEFWVWNLGEKPVWGASAPLYPLLLAIPRALGISPELSIIGVGLTLSSISLAAVTLMLARRFGFVVGIAFLAMAGLDTGVMYFSGAGLESPLTLSLLSFALWTLLYKPHVYFIGIAAGLLMVNKLDLVPVGGLLLLSHWYQDRKFPKYAFMVTVSIVVIWYGFAWWYFGAPVPNSFLTKSIYQNDHPKSIDWTWFGKYIFWVGIHKWLTFLSAIALLRNYRTLFPLIIFLGGMLSVHLVAYTIKYPFEPYNWYAMPALFALLVGGALGLAAISEYIGHYFNNRFIFVVSVAILTFGLVFFTNIEDERQDTSNIKMFASHHEFDRVEAGRWVEKNTPKNFVVYTMWGNPAYYSQRQVIDGSFLNRHYESVDLVSQYRPEILILQNNPGSTPMNPVFAATNGEHYKVVKVFDKTYLAGMDYFFAVLVREDVLDKVQDIDHPRNLMAFVNNVRLGDKFGILKPIGTETLFIHPGASVPTAFSFNIIDYLKDSKEKVISVNATMAPNISDDAVKRGGGNVRLQILQGRQQIVDEVVKVGVPMHRDISILSGQTLEFIVDNNGPADTDWLWLYIR